MDEIEINKFLQFVRDYQPEFGRGAINIDITEIEYALHKYHKQKDCIYCIKYGVI